MDSNGNIAYGVAMEYKISDDLLTYTFSLREDVFWKSRNGFYTQCTANDFVFAFRRLFNPEVKSQNADDYFCILNSKKINEGEMPLEELGVEAKNDFELVIRLEEPDPNLPILLTAPPAFPCNEEFYIHSAGRYGLTADAVASNGGFFLQEWVYDPHWTYENRIHLRRHNYNSSSERVEPLGINFLMSREDAGLTSFTAGQTDGLILSGDGVTQLIKRDYPYSGAETSVWGIVFNESRVFGSPDNESMRTALAYSVDRSSIDGLDKLTGYRATSYIIPDSIKVDGEFYREAAGSPDVSFSPPSLALTEQMAEHPVLIVPAGNEEVEHFARSIAQQWQEKLSLFCRIEVLTPHEYDEQISGGSYDIAVVKVTAGYNSPSSILNQLSKKSSKPKAADPEKIAEFYLKKEKEILSEAVFIPICFVTEYFFKAKKSEGLEYNPFTGAIRFREAKMY
jgi:oligopeptide transport system substrate-binding protein